MQCRLNARCRGLLETTIVTGSIHFIHRTASDFLKQPDVDAELRQSVEDFDELRSLAAGCLAELGSLNAERAMFAKGKYSFGLMELARKAEIRGREPHVRELEALTRILAASRTKGFRMFWRDSHNIGTKTQTMNLPIPAPLNPADTARQMVCSAGLRQVWSFVEWKVTKDPTLLDSLCGNSVLLAASFGAMYEPSSQATSLVKFLLERMTPPLGPNVLASGTALESHGRHTRLTPWTGPCWTAWSLFLLGAIGTLNANAPRDIIF